MTKTNIKAIGVATLLGGSLAVANAGELDLLESTAGLIEFRSSVELVSFNTADQAVPSGALTGLMGFAPLALQVSGTQSATTVVEADTQALDYPPAGFDNAGDPAVYGLGDTDASGDSGDPDLQLLGGDTDAGADPDEFEKAAKEVTDSTGKPIEGVKLGAAEKEAAAAEGAADSPSLLESVASAMRPEGGVPPLLNDRFSTYLSDQVVFLQFERNAARYDLEQGRASLGFMFSEERDTVFEIGLALDAPGTLSKNMRLSVGTKAYVALIGRENNDAFAAGFGLEAAYILPFEKLPLELGASFYYAPDVLTFGQGDRVVDALIDVTMPFRPGLSLFAGIRFLQIDTRPDDREIDNRVHFGIRWDLN